MSSASESTNNPDVKLNIDRIEIQYNEDASAASAQNYKVKICDFNDIYPSGIPQILNNFRCFYFITDKNNNLVEINQGNISQKISEADAISFLQRTDKSDFIVNNISYIAFFNIIHRLKKTFVNYY